MLSSSRCRKNGAPRESSYWRGAVWALHSRSREVHIFCETTQSNSGSRLSSRLQLQRGRTLTQRAQALAQQRDQKMLQSTPVTDFRAVYDEIARYAPELLHELHQEIDQFTFGRTEFDSQEAGRIILRTWVRGREWRNRCGGRQLSSCVFGYALWLYLRNSDWDISAITINSRSAKQFCRR